MSEHPSLDFLDTATASLDAIASNLDFIAEELPTNQIEPDLRLAVENVCSLFRGSLAVRRAQAKQMSDLIAGGVPMADELGEIAANLVGGLHSSCRQMHAVVTQLQQAADDGRKGAATIFVLVAESATNILNAYQSLEAFLQPLIEARRSQP